MVTNGTHSIFRLTSAAPLHIEDNVSDKVEFDGDAVVPDSKGRIISIKPIMRMIDNDNPVPGSQDAPGSQDVGNAPDFIEIRGYFDEATGKSLGPTSLRNWMRNPKKIKTLYPHGRFGFRSNVRDEWNVTPDTTGGYQLIYFDLDDTVELNQPKFLIRLKFVADKTLLGV